VFEPVRHENPSETVEGLAKYLNPLVISVTRGNHHDGYHWDEGELVRNLFHPSLIVALLLSAAAGPTAAQTFCDDPPSLTVLTGDNVTVSGLASEGHPAGYSWYITPPGASVPSKPTSTGPVYSFSPDFPGLWSVALVADYQHAAIGGGLWSSDDCITVAVWRR